MVVSEVCEKDSRIVDGGADPLDFQVRLIRPLRHKFDGSVGR